MSVRRWLPLLLSAALTGCGERAPAVPSTAAFIDSIGVNVHLSYTDTAYAHLDLVRRRLRELGVRHVRDGLVLGRPDQYRALRALASDGVRVQLILGDPAGRFGSGSLADQLATLERDLLPAVAAVEGPNEYDLSGDPQWAERVRAYQAELAAGLRARPALARLALVGPSVGRAGSRGELGDLSARLDFGNFHPYPGGEPPEANLAAEIDGARLVSGTRPLVATETGYHDALASPDLHAPVSEQAAAVYVPRLFLAYFRAGVRRTFAYELVDQRADPQGADLQASFGLLREDFSPKPAFVALQNLVAALQPEGERSPGPAPRVTTSGQTDGVQQLLLDQGRGTFALIVWSAARVWDPRARADLPAPSQRVRVELDHPASLAVIRPALSPVPERRLEAADTIDLDLAADPVVVRLRP